MRWNMKTDIDWTAFDITKVDRNILQVIKSAALVEANASDYVSYLCGVWHDDQSLQTQIKHWGAEETQHGKALARWAGLADPDFDFPAALKNFARMQAIDTSATTSIRGSRTGELVARCVVETGTSSLYAAIRDATDEPVLKELTGRIAADEFAHFSLFNALIQTQNQKLSRLARLKIALARTFESSDDELASAYYCAIRPPSDQHVYDRKIFHNAYLLGVLRIYQRRHIYRLVSMIAKAGGLKPQGILSRIFQPLVWSALNFHKNRLISRAISCI